MFSLSTKIKEILSLTDLVLLDIKHINNEKCKELVGYSNKLELEFARYLSENNIPIWVRQVIVPGITDDKNDLIKLREFISSLKSVQKIDLLPYHNMGKTKWENLGCSYPLSNVRNASEDDINRAREIILG